MSEGDAQREARVPLDTLMAIFGISKPTLFRWLAADKITTHGNGTKEKHVKWGDIIDASKRSTRWPR
ncbi:hypothetical protein [Microbacterium trichothecenolyticum]|uniref:hypothetical protein n=1 Tax=Microbacterium trichothecenolyticum TaxID=69370 RepID=UPI0005ECFC81|nr:hypothetical protein [Microbacterium trichothecenolyticum]